MWLMLDTGFVSIVEYRGDPQSLLVRSRVRADISRVFGDDVTVEEKPGADYLFRAVLPRERVAEVIAAKVMGLDYDSHAKDVALARSEPARGRRAAYYGTWTAMAGMQPIPPYSTAKVGA
jgi:hypothetical protein